MKNKIVGIFVCLLLITTCVVPVMGELITLKKSSNDINPLSSGTTSLKFMIAGNALRALRSFWLHVPPSYDGSKAIPLVIVLHGSTGFSLIYPLSFFRSSWIENYTEFSQKADKQGFIVLYPNGKYDFKFHEFDYKFGYIQNEFPKYVDDIGFLRTLIDKMKQEYNINLSRIYVTGMSAGAFMSYSVGAFLSDTVAAIAPVAGQIGCRMNENDSWSYIPTPARPVSVIVFHGTNDSLVSYEGDSYVASVNESIAFWVEHNGCNPTPEINTSASGKIIRRTYTNGKNVTEVILYTTVGGDHWWPGNHWILRPGAPWLFDTIQEISATDLIWDFFAAHPKQ
jgi:polyhydroxybutyrate depolymerase